MTEPAERYMGSSVPRKEDSALLTGRANWTDNIKLPGMLHMAVLRSPYAHAKIMHVDVSSALSQPGVIAAFTGEDLAEEWAVGIPCGWPVTEDIKTPDHWPLARDPMGVKGIGESGAIGSSPAVVNAVIDALAHEGVTHIDMPATPWKVWQAIRNARSGTDEVVGYPARTMGAS